MVVRNQIRKIDNALSAVMEGPPLTGTAHSKTIAEERAIHKHITKFKCLCGLILWLHILFQINVMSKSIQGIKFNISGAKEKQEKTKS